MRNFKLIFFTLFIFNYFEIQGQIDTIFFDNFNDNSIADKWTPSGNFVFETDSMLKLSNDITDNGGQIISASFEVNNKYPIKIYRRVFLTYSNDNVNHLSNLIFGTTPDFEDASTYGFGAHRNGVAVSYANYSSFSQYGLYIGSKWSSNTAISGIYSSPATMLWNEWFDEIITYDPTTGLATENINGSDVASITIDTLPSDKKYAKIYFLSYGWYTGHSHQLDYVLITQQKDSSNNMNNYLNVATNSIQLEGTSSANFELSSNTDWSISSNQSWLSIDKAQGTGNSIITVTASENLDDISRTATITILTNG